MDNKTLKYLRIFIPGFIILLGLYPIFIHYYNKLEIGINNELFIMIITFLSILLGSLYYQLNIQDLIKYPAVIIINHNIFNRLIEIFDKELTAEKYNALKKNNKYLDLYYKIIDNDNTLKIKGENIRFNGIFLTSTVDITFIYTILFIYYKIQNIIPYNIDFFSNFLIFSAITSVILHIITCKKHIKLCNKQLNYIETHKQEIKVNEVLELILKPSINEIVK